MSAELAITTALVAVSAMLLWVSFRYNESEDLWVGMISHLFHGFAIVLWLPILYTAYEFSLLLPGSAEIGIVVAPVLGIMGLLLFVYAMFMIIRTLLGIIRAFYNAARRMMSGQSERDPQEQIRRRSF